jgi:septal ring factor EnvC (AmiA/AmiB activator)
MNIKTIISIATGIFVLYAARLQVRLSDTKAKLKEAKTTIKAERAIKDSLNTELVQLQAQVYTDSSNYSQLVIDLQSIVKAARNETKAYKKENTELKAGLYRYRVNLFGKEKIEKKD